MKRHQSPHEKYMSEALSIAQRGVGWVDPNPLVGAVLVKDDQIIARGYHHKFGDLHAERDALAQCEVDPAGATLYVTLEPCCHYGKTPPCTEAIIDADITTVVIGAPDPNPLVAGKGVEQLRKAGIEVIEGVLLDECTRANEVFFHYIQNEMPFVVLKYAMTLDGKIATRTGSSQWITSEAARNRVHDDRHRYSAIMVGIGTVLADNPRLNCRREKPSRDPFRIIVDRQARTPLEATIVQSALEIPTLIATTDAAPVERREALEAQGCEVVVFPDEDKRVPLRKLMSFLAKEKQLDSVYVEGGAQLAASLLHEGLVNKVHAYIAPKIFGGKDAPSPVQGKGVSLASQALVLSRPQVTLYGDDVLLECEVL